MQTWAQRPVRTGVRKVAIQRQSRDWHGTWSRSIFQACSGHTKVVQKRFFAERSALVRATDYQPLKSGFRTSCCNLIFCKYGMEKSAGAEGTGGSAFRGPLLPRRKLCAEMSSASSLYSSNAARQQSDAADRPKTAWNSVASMALRRECGFSSLSQPVFQSIRSPEEHSP